MISELEKFMFQATPYSLTHHELHCEIPGNRLHSCRAAEHPQQDTCNLG